jgi:hypothetical protein
LAFGFDPSNRKRRAKSAFVNSAAQKRAAVKN